MSLWCYCCVVGGTFPYGSDEDTPIASSRFPSCLSTYFRIGSGAYPSKDKKSLQPQL